MMRTDLRRAAVDRDDLERLLHEHTDAISDNQIVRKNSFRKQRPPSHE